MVAAGWVRAREATEANLWSGAWRAGQKHLSCVFGGSSRFNVGAPQERPEASGVDIWPHVLGASPQLLAPSISPGVCFGPCRGCEVTMVG